MVFVLPDFITKIKLLRISNVTFNYTTLNHKHNQELTVPQIMNSLLLLVQHLAKSFLTLEIFEMYYKMGFSKIQHQPWHGKIAGVSTENRFFISHAARTGTLPRGIPNLGQKPAEGAPTASPLSHAEVESGTQKMHGNAP